MEIQSQGYHESKNVELSCKFGNPFSRSLESFCSETDGPVLPSSTTGIFCNIITILHCQIYLMESRKRPLSDEDDSVVTKKRILTGANGSPHVNGVAEHDDEAFGEKLEAILLSI